MINPKCKIIMSRYKEDFSWIHEYTEDYLIYNKGDPIEDDSHIINTENIGGNQRDIFKFIYENYDDLPELMAFVQADPFDHCTKDIFDKLIMNEEFTCLEYYGTEPANGLEGRDYDGGFMELNSDWYIPAHNGTYGITCKYQYFDDFMKSKFRNYHRVDWIRFAPGSQYLITKEQALFYSRNFWKDMMEELPRNNMTEAHIIERSLWMIFLCKLEAKIDKF